MKTTGRDKLIEATKQLLWETGYAATSPNDILARSGVGQGSFYYHFAGKRELAAAALESSADDLIGIGAEQLAEHKSGVTRLRTYLLGERDALRGCRLGRIAYDTAIDEKILRAPVLRYFEEVRRLVADALREMQEVGELPASASPDTLAATAVAVVQGGYILARVHGDAEHMRTAVNGFMSLLSLAAADKGE